MLHFLHRLDHQLEKFFLIMFKGGLSSRGTIADERNFRNVVIIFVGSFFNASGSVVPDKNSVRNACLAGNLWPGMEVSIKGAESGKVLVLNPFVATQQGLRFCLSLDSTSLLMMVLTLLSVLDHSMTSDINLAQNSCSMEIKLISLMKKIIKRNRLDIFTEGDRGKDGDNAKGNVMLCKLPLCIFNDIFLRAQSRGKILWGSWNFAEWQSKN
jgi:hypothetical protein